MKSNGSSRHEADLDTVRQLYSEAQQWARHYEQLLVNANTLIISAAFIFVGLAMGDQVTLLRSRLLLGLPMLMSVIGIGITQMLFKLYEATITRLIRYEQIMGCFDPAMGARLDGKAAVMPAHLQNLPVPWPASARFFFGLHCLLELCHLGMMWIKVL